MRDKKRIEPMLTKIEEVWKNHPQLRFGQLLVKVTGREDPFYVEDDILLKLLDKELILQNEETTETEPDRIPCIIEAIRKYWKRYPDWRLCQLAVNVSYNLGEISDERFLKNVIDGGTRWL